MLQRCQCCRCNNSRIPKVTNKTRALENNNNNNNEKAVQRKQTLTTALTTNTTTINNKWAATMQIPNENDVIAALIQKPPNSCLWYIKIEGSERAQARKKSQQACIQKDMKMAKKVFYFVLTWMN